VAALFAAANGFAAETVAPHVSPETNAPPSLPLEALVTEALEKNPELRFYQAEIAAAKGGRRTAGLCRIPK
jgi:outer membrane protein TolC